MDDQKGTVIVVAGKGVTSTTRGDLYTNLSSVNRKKRRLSEKQVSRALESGLPGRPSTLRCVPPGSIGDYVAKASQPR